MWTKTHPAIQTSKSRYTLKITEYSVIPYRQWKTNINHTCISLITERRQLAPDKLLYMQFDDTEVVLVSEFVAVFTNTLQA